MFETFNEYIDLREKSFHNVQHCLIHSTLIAAHPWSSAVSGYPFSKTPPHRSNPPCLLGSGSTFLSFFSTLHSFVFTLCLWGEYLFAHVADRSRTVAACAPQRWLFPCLPPFLVAQKSPIGGASRACRRPLRRQSV